MISDTAWVQAGIQLPVPHGPADAMFSIEVENCRQTKSVKKTIIFVT